MKKKIPQFVHDDETDQMNLLSQKLRKIMKNKI